MIKFLSFITLDLDACQFFFLHFLFLSIFFSEHSKLRELQGCKKIFFEYNDGFDISISFFCSFFIFKMNIQKVFSDKFRWYSAILSTYIWVAIVYLLMSWPLWPEFSQKTDPFPSNTAKQPFNESEEPVFFLQYSDTHVNHINSTFNERFQEGVRYHEMMKPTMTIHSGDMVDDFVLKFQIEFRRKDVLIAGDGFEVIGVNGVDFTYHALIRGIGKGDYC